LTHSLGNSSPFQLLGSSAFLEYDNPVGLVCFFQPPNPFPDAGGADIGLNVCATRGIQNLLLQL
jgi:hypothetical protein